MRADTNVYQPALGVLSPFFLIFLRAREMAIELGCVEFCKASISSDVRGQHDSIYPSLLVCFQ